MPLPLFLLLLSLLLSPTLAQEDEWGLLQTTDFSPGIMLLFMAYVAIISATVGEYHHAIKESTFWNQSQEKQMEARRYIVRGTLEAIAIFMILITAFASIVALMVDPLDQRMLYIINGISRLTAAVVLALLSIRVALWIGLYYPYKWKDDIEKTLGTTQIELKHRVRWSVSKKFLRSFFFLLVILQEGGGEPITIPVSILAGIVGGFVIDFCIYKCRRFESKACQRCSSITMVIVFILAAISAFATGVFFIAAVWQDVDDVMDTDWDVYATLIGAFVLPAVHILVWQLGKIDKAADLRDMRQQNSMTGGDGGANVNTNTNANGDGTAGVSESITSRQKRAKQRMAASMFFSGRNIIEDMAKREEEEKQEAMDAVAEGDEEEENEILNSKEVEEEQAIPVILPPVVVPDGDDVENDETKDMTDESNNNELPPTLTQLMMQWQCCGCARGDEKTATQKALNVINWIMYVVLVLICLLLLITNMGSTYQQEAARVKLPQVYDLIYRDIDLGPVCAFDDKGADSNITTFEDKDAAHNANFKILHCGACAACSDWHNLELEYTTREFLADEGRKCAQKSLFGGGYDTLVECLEDEPIGFQGKCAKCWADDILCTKGFCAMIGLQSFMINTLTNFAVGENTITAAACEEAHCEAGNPGFFVSCSGATRRRMNVTSTIARPGTQRCTISDVDWAELFPNPHPTSG